MHSKISDIERVGLRSKVYGQGTTRIPQYEDKRGSKTIESNDFKPYQATDTNDSSAIYSDNPLQGRRKNIAHIPVPNGRNIQSKFSSLPSQAKKANLPIINGPRMNSNERPAGNTLRKSHERVP